MFGIFSVISFTQILNELTEDFAENLVFFLLLKTVFPENQITKYELDLTLIIGFV